MGGCCIKVLVSTVDAVLLNEVPCGAFPAGGELTDAAGATVVNGLVVCNCEPNASLTIWNIH